MIFVVAVMDNAATLDLARMLVDISGAAHDLLGQIPATLFLIPQDNHSRPVIITGIIE